MISPLCAPQLTDSMWEDGKKKLEQLINLQSVGNPKHPQFQIQALFKTAIFVGQELANMGFNVEYIKIEECSAPFLFAQKIIDTKLPTILFFSHYDTDYDNLPELFSLKGELLCGTGINEGKGEIILFLTTLAAFKPPELSPCSKSSTFKKFDIKLPVNVKILLEGERKSSSPHLEKLLRKNAEKLNATALISFHGRNSSTQIGHFAYSPLNQTPNEQNTATSANSSVEIASIKNFQTVLCPKEAGPFCIAYLKVLSSHFNIATGQRLEDLPPHLTSFRSLFPQLQIIMPPLQGPHRTPCIIVYRRTINILLNFLHEAAKVQQDK